MKQQEKLYGIHITVALQLLCLQNFQHGQLTDKHFCDKKLLKYSGKSIILYVEIRNNCT